MKVAHLDHTRERGGAEYALVRILTSPARSWDATVILPRTADPALGVFEAVRGGDVEVVECGLAQGPGVSAAGLAGLFRFGVQLLRQAASLRWSKAVRDSGVMHANTSRAAAYGALALLFSRKAFVVHLRDLVDKEALGTAGYLLMTRLVLRRADGVIANSKATLDSVEAVLRPRTKTAVLPSAIGAIGVRPRVRGDTFRIGMAARLDPWKGQRELIDAFARAFPNDRSELVLAGAAAFGHETYESSLKTRVRALGLQDRVKFLGHVDDVDSVLASLDVCVHASTRPEPLGQNVLQYLAAGRATIAVDAGGPAEWIEHDRNGRLYGINDFDTLSDELRRLRDDEEERARLAVAAAATEGLPTDAKVAEWHGEFFAAVRDDRATGLRR